MLAKHSISLFFAWLLGAIVIIVVNWDYSRVALAQAHLADGSIANSQTSTGFDPVSEVTVKDVLRHPLSSDVVTAYATYQIANGTRTGSTAMAFAAELGWRAVDAQKAVAVAAIQGRKWDVAASRIVALARLKMLDGMEFHLDREDSHILATALNSRFIDSADGWFYLLRWLRSSHLHSLREELVRDQQFLRSATQCEALGDFATEEIDLGNVELGIQAVGGKCRAYLSDLDDFSPVTRTTALDSHGPFEWRMFESSSVRISADKSGRLASFRISNNSSGEELVLSRLVSATGLDTMARIEVVDGSNPGAGSAALRTLTTCVGAIQSKRSEDLFDPFAGARSQCRLFRIQIFLKPGDYILMI